MSLTATRRGDSDLEALDLDVTPVMNMLLILIPLLVSMAVMTQLSVIQFNLPPDSAAASEAGEPKKDEVDITVVLSESGLQIIGEGKKLDPIPKEGGKYNFPQLGVYLQKMKREYPATESLVLLIDKDVLYEDIVSAMDVCRDNQFPNVALSGGIGS